MTDGVQLQAGEQIRAFTEDAGAAVNDLVREAVLLDKVDYCLIVCTGLQPQRRDAEGLGLFKETKSNLQDYMRQIFEEARIADEIPWVL